MYALFVGGDVPDAPLVPYVSFEMFTPNKRMTVGGLSDPERDRAEARPLRKRHQLNHQRRFVVALVTFVGGGQDLLGQRLGGGLALGGQKLL